MTETIVCLILRPGRPASWSPECMLGNRQCFWKHCELGPFFLGDAHPPRSIWGISVSWIVREPVLVSRIGGQVQRLEACRARCESYSCSNTETTAGLPGRREAVCLLRRGRRPVPGQEERAQNSQDLQTSASPWPRPLSE